MVANIIQKLLDIHAKEYDINAHKVIVDVRTFQRLLDEVPILNGQGNNKVLFGVPLCKEDSYGEIKIKII